MTSKEKVEIENIEEILSGLICDINLKEIGSHIQDNTLAEWVTNWKREASRLCYRLRKVPEMEITDLPMGDCFTVGFDNKKGERPVLVVVRSEQNGLYIINQAFDEEAEEIYKRLTGKGGEI